MGILTRFLLAALLVSAAGGCALPLHYNMAYTRLHDAKGEAFIQHDGDVEYRETEDMAAAEEEMYRKGYIMVGYSNMDSPQLSAIAPDAARNQAKSVGAAAVVHQYGRGRYLATFWSRPRTFILGAYYADLPPDARLAVGSDQGVIVLNTVEASPAFQAGIEPGDLLLFLNDRRIANSEGLGEMLKEHAGRQVTFTVWPYAGAPPVPVDVRLNAAR